MLTYVYSIGLVYIKGELVMAIQPIEAGMIVHQVLDAEGNLVGDMPDLSVERLLALYRAMLLGRAFSNKIIALQRQGRAATSSVSIGQEATSVGLAAPMQQQDWLASSYREIPSLIVRGIPPSILIYMRRGYTPAYPQEAHCLPFQIVIGTQIIHAVGLAMAAKISGDPVVAVGVCGDGATSEGDFNEALNFAGVFQAPAVIVIQNNGWAISVPRKRQCAASTLAARGAGFGIPSYLVDGNDLFAVYAVMQQALERARSGQGPTLIEAVTYRIGAHTTADDPTRYRDPAEVEAWKAKDPIARVRRFLLASDQLTEVQDEQLLEQVESDINRAAAEAEAMAPHAPDSFFEHTAASLPERLQEQREDLLRYIRK